MSPDENYDTHQFVVTKPPVSDPITYLTLLEYNLKADNIGILQRVLNDDADGNGTLYKDIGWDLIALLLPFVRQLTARDCLRDIAKKGNHRECALKVVENLQLLDWKDFEDEEKEEEDQHNDAETQASADRIKRDDPLTYIQLTTLMQMAGIIYPYIRTKQPSRFLNELISAMCTALSKVPPEQTERCIDQAIVAMAVFRSSHKPALPPRGGNATRQDVSYNAGARPTDPNSKAEAPALESTDAVAQRKLLQAFVTQLVELWITSQEMIEDEDAFEVPGLALAPRFLERLEPSKVIPGRVTVNQQFEDKASLRSRSQFRAKLARLAQSVGMNSEQLLSRSAEAGLVLDDTVGDPSAEKAAASDLEIIPFSGRACMILFASQIFERIIEGGDISDAMAAIHFDEDLFPDIDNLFIKHIGLPGDAIAMGPHQPHAVIDALLFLALLSHARQKVGELSTDPDQATAFYRFLQTTSILSVDIPNIHIHSCAQQLTARVLRSHPSAQVRMHFIKSTLECDSSEYGSAPLLKANAVNWLKTEIVEATKVAIADQETNATLFSSPIALHMLSPLLYPDLQPLIPRISGSTAEGATTSPIEIFHRLVKPDLPFYLAALNFHYFLCTLPLQLRESLDVLGVHNDADVATSFLTPLREISHKVEHALDSEEIPSHFDDLAEARSDIMLLQQAMEQVESRLIAIAKDGA